MSVGRVLRNVGWALFTVFVVWAWWTEDTSGLLLSGQMPESVRTELRDVGVDESEQAVAFYDFSLGTLSEYTALTSERLLYVKDDQLTSIPYGDIASVESQDVMIGADILVVANDGRMVLLPMANDPELFVRALDQQRTKHRDSATLAETSSPSE